MFKSTRRRLAQALSREGADTTLRLSIDTVTRTRLECFVAIVGAMKRRRIFDKASHLLRIILSDVRHIFTASAAIVRQHFADFNKHFCRQYFLLREEQAS